MRCKHEEWSGKKRCGLTDPKAYYRHCLKCGGLKFGHDDRDAKAKRPRVRLEDK